MYNTRRGENSGGWKGGKKSGSGGTWKKSYDSRDSARPALHNATCNKCGNACQVPFKPNGSKPVLCRDCFKREGGATSSRPAGAGFGRPSFRENRPFAAPSANTAQIDAQLKAINEKLDAIMEALSD